MYLKHRNIKLLFLSLYIIFFVLLLSQPINLTTADLGRHIKNGELLFQNTGILSSNFYSYTYPNFPFINHHWGSGVIFYIIHLLFGFIGQSIIFILITLLTFIIFFKVAIKYSNFEVSLLTAFLTLPLMASRTEIRPEMFSYLFIALFLWIAINYINHSLHRNLIWFIPLIILLWVNLHIYYLFGFVILGVFILEYAINLFIFKKGKLVQLIKLLIVSLISLPLIFLNPNFIKGALYPLHIFDNYGYRLVENQSVSFIEKVLPNYPSLPFFKLVLIFLISSWILIIFKSIKEKKLHFSIALLLISIFFSYLALTGIRNFSIFAYFAFTISAINIYNLKLKISPEYQNYLPPTIALATICIFFIISPSYWSKLSTVGLGLMPNILASADFFNSNNIQGPIFNNYDIGGYLIYTLYPKQQVFVDNRPEAYPAQFFEKEYIPMQENDPLWNQLLAKHQFNTIFFYRHDLTPWSQKFLINRIKDRANWLPVFVDDYVIIFLKNNPQNQKLIEKYQLPETMFQVK